uniref:Peptidase C1A papain C-terminal domain-containing protein n=1 Tax=Mucochytrium quahogii TaxID=96639 RepID=A0A7S2W4K0_9STRA|mmetsp:Transcript_19890/g.32715  ORF Transcript_19890/g.32715 Transcript_19890/m.32715 type:complete len:677 (+) Transcript_19890:136-2166(+)
MRILLALAAAAGLAKGDLPSHCMGGEFIGEWDVKMTAPSSVEVDAQLFNMTQVCGHARPDDFKTSIEVNDGFDNWFIKRLKDRHANLTGLKVDEYRLCVKYANGTDAKICPRSGKENKDVCSSGDGCKAVSFSMVYDEGFMFSTTMFGPLTQHVAFFRYAPLNGGSSIPDGNILSKWKTQCDATISGTYTASGEFLNQQHNGSIYRGCFVAKKTQKVAEHPSEMRGKELVVDMDTQVGGHSALQLHSASLLQLNQGAKSKSLGKASQHSMAHQAARMTTFLDSEFKVSREFVDRINGLQLGWEAQLDSATSFGGNNRAALLRLGIAQQSHSSSYLESLQHRLLQMGATDFNRDTSEERSSLSTEEFAEQVISTSPTYSVLSSQHEKEDEKKENTCALQVLPKNFSWTDSNMSRCPGVVSDAVDQGSCGSCYAMAATRAASFRYRIANHPDENCSKGNGSKKALSTLFSAQGVLDCSYLNQGCDGGYPVLAAYHGFSEGFMDTSCDKYIHKSETCSAKKNCTKYFVKDFHYAGGAYGYGTNMHDMMFDLIKYGPLTVGIDASPELQVYRRGIFSPLWDASNQRLKYGNSVWTKTTHAIVLVGWGEETLTGKDGKPVTVPYWILQNTWGKHWGDEGLFKVKRGSDEIAVESMPVSIRFSDTVSEVSKEYVKKYEECMK